MCRGGELNHVGEAVERGVVDDIFIVFEVCPRGIGTLHPVNTVVAFGCLREGAIDAMKVYAFPQ